MAVKLEAFVLAGGKSSRMGHDKGLVSLKDKPMITYVLESLQGAALPITIIAHDPAYESFGFPVISDVVSEKGPLGGLLTAFRHTTADVVLLISCDMPLISIEAIRLLMDQVEKEKIIAAEVAGRINPLFAFYPTSLREKVVQCISEDQLKMTDFVLQNSHTLVSSIFLKMPWCFENINDEKKLKYIEEKWGHLL